MIFIALMPLVWLCILVSAAALWVGCQLQELSKLVGNQWLMAGCVMVSSKDRYTFQAF